jgi:hypothetical protein
VLIIPPNIDCSEMQTEMVDGVSGSPYDQLGGLYVITSKDKSCVRSPIAIGTVKFGSARGLFALDPFLHVAGA